MKSEEFIRPSILRNFLYIFLFVYPLIVRFALIPTPYGSEAYAVHPLGEYNGDFFSFYKSILLFGTAIVLLVYLKIRNKMVNNIVVMLSGGYLVTTMISSILSKYKSVALWGAGNRYEGFLSLFSYVIIFLFVYSVAEKKEEKNISFVYTMIGVAVAIVGISEFFGVSILKMHLLKELVLPKMEDYIKVIYPDGYISIGDIINRSIRFARIKATYGNSNYGGSLFSLIIFMNLAQIFREKRLKFIYIITYTLVTFAFFCTGSRAGLLGVLIGFIFIIVFLKNEIYSNKMVFILLLFITIISFVSVERIFDFNGRNLVIKNSNSTKIVESRNKFDIYTEKNRVTLSYGAKEYKLIFNNKFLEVIIDSEKNIYDYNKDIAISSNIKLNIISESQYDLQINNSTLKFIKIGEELVYKDSYRISKLRRIEKVKILDKYFWVGSNRFYIWARSIPLMKDYILWGVGPDMFSTVFPQDDFIGKKFAYGTENIFISKPHNMYINISITTGMVSLVCFLGIIFFYLYSFFKSEFSKKSLVEKCIFCSIISYLITGLFNDSVVSVAPLFWVLIAFAMALQRNGLVKSEE